MSSYWPQLSRSPAETKETEDNQREPSSPFTVRTVQYVPSFFCDTQSKQLTSFLLGTRTATCSSLDVHALDFQGPEGARDLENQAGTRGCARRSGRSRGAVDAANNALRERAGMSSVVSSVK